MRAITGHLHPLAQREYDRGEVDPAMPMDHMLVLFQPTTEQQAGLDELLAAQQNPSSPLFHQWLLPEEFGDRFGLSAADQSKVAAWLAAEGFTINETGRARNWIAFSGTAGQVSRALRAPIHRLDVDGERHFSVTAEPSVPEALAGVVAGFMGLNDFHLKPLAVRPQFNSGSSHYLAPEDYATIYNIAPLYQAGIDGSGQSIAVVGQSAVLVSDLRTFRTRHNLPANDPKIMLYSTTDPGFTDAQIEGNLDLEWAGAIAPKATLYYVYGPSAITAFVAAVNANLAPIVSISYGGCEIGFRPSFYRSIGQQANAQGITVLAASGDSGAAGCDAQGVYPFATQGRMADFPAVLPEVTAVGGTQFTEGSGTYWAKSNSANFGSALSYIPEAAWNESGTGGLLSGGGGTSLFYPKPAWQSAPGVPDANARHTPDVSLSGSTHDAYYITYLGSGAAVGGTSAGAPSMAGIVALLSQYQVAKGFQQQPGLGNINPQLYRLARSAPSVFHDVVSGDNVVSCALGSPDCASGSYGYAAGPGYDLATGLGSVDANALAAQWNAPAAAVSVNLVVSATRVSVNDTVAATALVTAAGGGTPSGTVSFSAGGLALGSATLAPRGGQQAADITFPVYQLGTGSFTLTAAYNGDAAFGTGGATKTIQVAVPVGGAAAIVPSAPNTVWPAPPDAQGLAWQTPLSLREVAGVPARLTGFTIDGVAQSLAGYFPATEIPARGTISAVVTFRDLAVPLLRTFGFTGVDASGQAWARQVVVNYFGLPPLTDFNLSASPLVVTRNPAADPGCQYSVLLHIDDTTGTLNAVLGLSAGGVDLSDRIVPIFGTTRLDAWGSLQGTVCFGDIPPGTENDIAVLLSNGVQRELTVAFAAAPAVPASISVAPTAVNLSPSAPLASLAVDLSDKAQAWRASVFPANRTTSWLRLSQRSGTGPAGLSLSAEGAGFAPGAYRATVVIEAPNAVPPVVSVPVMFVLGAGGSGMAISGAANSAAYSSTTAAPGMLLTVFGSKLADAAASASGSQLPYTLGSVTATVNGIRAPLVSVSPNQVKLQVPYSTGSGPAALGINNNGQVAGVQIQIAPAAPAIFTDADGNLAGAAAVQPGGTATAYITGAGEVTPALKTAYAPSASTSVSGLPRPMLPVSVTVGSLPAFVEYAGNSAGLIGTIQVNFLVPASVAAGVQPVVVTVAGQASPPVNMTVQAAEPVTATAAR